MNVTPMITLLQAVEYEVASSRWIRVGSALRLKWFMAWWLSSRAISKHGRYQKFKVGVAAHKLGEMS